MIASNHDGEFTFYEELGVARDASPEQIRDAFRLFVRLLHPDQQTDPQLKEFAENQMRKLNRIHDVLSDPERRRRYNQTLDGAYVPPIVLDSPSPALRRFAAGLTWGAAIMLSAGLLIWLASQNSPIAPTRIPDQAGVPASSSAAPPASSRLAASAAADRAALSTRISRLQADLNAVTVERDAAIAELNRLRRNSQLSKVSVSGPIGTTDPQPALTITQLPSDPRLPEVDGSAPVQTDPATKRRFAGFWFYAKPSQGQNNRNRSLYPPEYIEATITESGGTIRGSLHSRFQISDRAISPEVNFTFTGVAAGAQISCPWTGAGGAKGDVTLKLTSDNSLRVDWVATELGTQQGLISGTAILTRRIE